MNAIENPGLLSVQDFAVLGMEHVAYIRPVIVDGESVFAIHTADGTRIGLTRDHAIATETLRQHELEPLSVH